MSLKHQQQPTHNSCMSACIAMISGQPVNEVVAQWHDKFHSKEAWLDDAWIITTFRISMGTRRRLSFSLILFISSQFHH
jgi:hypothetical protein